jgi:hypothetical protein
LKTKPEKPKPKPTVFSNLEKNRRRTQEQKNRRTEEEKNKRRE